MRPKRLTNRPKTIYPSGRQMHTTSEKWRSPKHSGAQSIRSPCSVNLDGTFARKNLLLDRLNNCFYSSLSRSRLQMRTIFTVFTALSSIIGSCGIILNFSVCITYFLNPQLLDASNIFILNISTGDLLYSIVALPMLVVSNARGEWSFGEAGCTADGFLTTFFALGSLLNLAGAAYERYFTLCKLYDNGEAQFSRKKALLISMLLWCYSFFWSVTPVLGWSSYVQEGIGTSCSVNWRSREVRDSSYAICLMLACFALPVFVIAFYHFKSYRVMLKLSE